MKKLIIGIDPGTYTGVAIWDYEKKEFLSITTLKIHHAMNLISRLQARATEYGETQIDLVIFEDARKRKGGFKRGAEQGAGSVKRDCSIWEDFLKDSKLPFLKSLPKNTKMLDGMFKKLTNWEGRTSSHARDAAMIVFGINAHQVQIKKATMELRRTSRTKSNPDSI